MLNVCELCRVEHTSLLNIWTKDNPCWICLKCKELLGVFYKMRNEQTIIKRGLRIMGDIKRTDKSGFERMIHIVRLKEIAWTLNYPKKKLFIHEFLEWSTNRLKELYTNCY